MAGSLPITEEVSNSKVAAVFDDEAVAREQAARLKQAIGLTDSQVRVVTPRSADPARRLQPESHGIFRTMLYAHARLGVVGLVVGALAFGVLWWAGIPMIVNSPLAALGVLLFFGGTAGLMLGGLVTLRPDHDPYVFKVMGALEEGSSAVVVHAYDVVQRADAQRYLESVGGRTVTTL